MELFRHTSDNQATTEQVEKAVAETMEHESLKERVLCFFNEISLGLLFRPRKSDEVILIDWDDVESLTASKEKSDAASEMAADIIGTALRNGTLKF